MSEKFGFADLIVPLYIDSETVLSLLGRIEGGIDVRTSVMIERGTATTRTNKTEADASGAVPFFHLLRVGGQASHEGSKGSTDKEQWQHERTETIGSLLQRLRTALIENSLLPAVGDSISYEKLGAGEFVEFSGTFKPNPLVKTLDTAQRLLSLFETFVTKPGNPVQQKGKGGGGKASAPVVQQSQLSPVIRRMFPTANPQWLIDNLPVLSHINTQILKPLHGELVTGVSNAYIVEASDSDYRAVVTLLDDFVRNLTADEIGGREMRVLGKVVRHVSDDTGGVELLRGSSLALFEDKLAPITESQEVQDFLGSALETTVMGPVLEIVPIAVYV